MSKKEPQSGTTEPVATEKSPARKKLELLESTGEYLFHGSPTTDIEEFEPRQAMTGDEVTKVMHNDGPPGVAAAEIADIAVFRAIVHKNNLPKNSPFSSSFSGDIETQLYGVDERTIQKLKDSDSVGYVYVFRKSDFQPYSGLEWRSEKPVRPVDVVAVSLGDLPKYVITES